MKFPLILCACLAAILSAQTVTLSDFPRTLQLYPRAADGYADVPVRGTVASACTVALSVTRNGTLFSQMERVLPGDSGLAFSFTVRIRGENAEYGFLLEAGDSLVRQADSVVAGDVYLIDGQSNAATGTSYYTSEWLRSFGPTPLAFCPGQSTSSWSNGYLCAWGAELGKLLVEQAGIPVLIINGAVGGTRIELHLKNGDIYNSLLNRVQLAGVVGKARAMCWNQGEANTVDSNYLPYAQFFDSLYRDWKADFGISHVYTFQLRPCCDYTGFHNRSELADLQRTIAHDYTDVSVIASSGIGYYTDNHYSDVGYRRMAEWLFPLINHDFYGSLDTLYMRSPDLIRAYYTGAAQDTIALQFTQPVLWPSNAGSYAMKDYLYLDGLDSVFLSGTAVPEENTIRLALKNPGQGSTITYLPDTYYKNSSTYYNGGPWLLNPKGIGALSFCNVPIESPKSSDTSRITGVRILAGNNPLSQYLSTVLSLVVSFESGAVDTIRNMGAYRSLDTSVAVILPNGLAVGCSAGDARITGTWRNISDTLTLTVGPKLAADSLRLDRSSVPLFTGDSLSVHATAFFHQDGVVFKAVADTLAAWASSDPAAVSADNGLVRAVGQGNTVAVTAGLDGVFDTLWVSAWSKPGFVRRINFQTTTTPFKEGWLADNGGAYTAGKSYGWVDAAGPVSRADRAGGNYLLKTFVVNAAPTAYQVDLPDGRYVIRIGTGDNLWGEGVLSWVAHGSDTLISYLGWESRLFGLGNAVKTDTVEVSGGTGLTLSVMKVICFLTIISLEGLTSGTDPALLFDDGIEEKALITGLEKEVMPEPLTFEVAPNPFNPVVRFRMNYGLKNANLKIFDCSGRLAVNLGNKVEWNAAGRPSGLYFAVLECDGKRLIRKLVLSK